MHHKPQQRTEKEIIVMGLSFTYAVCVSVFAVIRLLNEDWVIGILDAVLALFGLLVFLLVWRTGNVVLPAYVIAFVAMVGTILTLVLKGPDQVYWAYPSTALVFYLLPPKHALSMWAVAAVIIFLLILELPPITLTAVIMTLLITGFFCHLFSQKMYQQHERLRKIANQDALTLTKNRRAYNHDTAAVVNDHGHCTLLLFDLDNFKQVNDYFGHAVGDELLVKTAQFVASKLSPDDVLYRIGGDEFAVLFKQKDFAYGYQMATTIHQTYANSTMNQMHQVTLSVAVGQKEHDESLEDWLGRLDSALYQAKKSGRNQVVKAIRH